MFGYLVHKIYIFAGHVDLHASVVMPYSSSVKYTTDIWFSKCELIPSTRTLKHKMQLQSILFTLLTLAGYTQAVERSLDIYSKSVKSGSIVSLGQIKYDTITNTTKYLATNDLPSHDSICIGTKQLPSKECFTYLETTETTPKGKFALFLNGDRELTEIALYAGEEDWDSELIESSSAPLPNLKPFIRQKQKPKAEPVKQKVIRKKTVEIDGKKTEIEEVIEEVIEEDDRLWLQKNWMWIVVPLGLFLIMAPEEEKKEN